MTTKTSGSSTIYWLIGITPITSAIIYFAFRLFGIDIGVRGVLLMVVLLLVGRRNGRRFDGGLFHIGFLYKRTFIRDPLPTR